MNRILALMLAVLVLSAPAFAQDGVTNVTRPGYTTFPVLTAGQEFTTSPVTVVGATSFGLSWYHVTASGSPSVNVIILQANANGDGFTQWATPVTGSAITNNVTLTTVRGGSALALSPSRLVSLRVINSGSQNVTPTMRFYAR